MARRHGTALSATGLDRHTPADQDVSAGTLTGHPVSTPASGPVSCAPAPAGGGSAGARGAEPRGGLVLCATTARGTTDPQVTGSPASGEWSSLVDRAWSPAFPSAELVRTVAGLLPALRRGDVGGELPEGPTWRITVAPGAVAVGTRDYARADRTAERQEEARRLDVDADVAAYLESGQWPDEPEPQRVITEWSRKSRGRMVRRLCELDYAPLVTDEDGARRDRLPAMVTLTYPGEWQVVAPNGKAAKAHLRAFRQRWRRAWDEDPPALWKQEFQGRGAPHFHLLMVPPHGRDNVLGLTFRAWLSRVWAEIVDHPDPDERARHELAGTGVDYAEGLRASDPRRVAAYFLGHNSAGPGGKEYQHRVPEEWQEPGQGPGRFWGYWNLSPARAVVEVTPDTAVAAARTMRRWSRAQRRTRKVTRPRTEGGAVVPRDAVVEGLTGAQLVQEPRRVRYRRTTVRAVLVPRGRGWVAVNDGPAFAADLARYLSTITGSDDTA